MEDCFATETTETTEVFGFFYLYWTGLKIQSKSLYIQKLFQNIDINNYIC